jgi:hypothetical protein
VAAADRELAAAEAGDGAAGGGAVAPADGGGEVAGGLPGKPVSVKVATVPLKECPSVALTALPVPLSESPSATTAPPVAVAVAVPGASSARVTWVRKVPSSA